MTYNVQWFTGINSQLDMQKQIVNKYHADIIGLQELTTTGRINSIGRKTLAGYENQYISLHKNYLGIASVFPLTDVKCVDFKHQDPEDRKQYNETRAYMIAHLQIGGKTITLINTHLCYLTKTVKLQQMGEIFNRANKSKYVIITGDFNSFEGEYAQMYQRFIDAGYHLANCETKITKTWTDKPTAKWLPQLKFATDNIITSGNIEIKKSMFNKTKFSYPNGCAIDHIPVITRLWIR